MINYDDIEETRKYTISTSIECDCCGKTIEYSDGTLKSFEADNFISIRKSFGYGSDIGDEEEISIDICEQCFIEKFGIEFIRRHVV
jgi:hypothetical protein